MNRTRILIGGLAVLGVGGALLFGGLFGSPGANPARAAAPVSAADSAALTHLLVGLAGNNTQAYIATLERRLAARPHDHDALLLVGLAYQQRARETGDPRFFTLSDRALHEARAFPADEPLAETGLASLAVSRHRFASAVPLARTALHADPENAVAYGALGDAFLNLGRYHEAFSAYDRMAELSPSVASYGRVAHARELIGRPRGAAEALGLALTLRTPIREHRAAALVQLGNIRFNIGNLSGALRAYEAALVALPGYVHAQAGLAHTEAAEGDFRHAVPLFRRVVERLPLPQYAIWQGDTLHAAGFGAQARRAYALVSFIDRVQAANGVRTELQTALFDLDHGRRLANALERAEAAHTRSPSIDADDVLGWALLRNGHCREALPYSQASLRLGTRDALKFFHRGAIERCLGHGDQARAWIRRALALNPQFSLLWAPVARRWLS